jgi:uncharacterized protein YhdP
MQMGPNGRSVHRNVNWDETSDGEIVVQWNLPMNANLTIHMDVPLHGRHPARRAASAVILSTQDLLMSGHDTA